MQVTPSTIETQLMAHWAVNDVAVIGLPHDIDGEHPLACVVIRKDQQGRPLVSTKELIDFANGIDSFLLSYIIDSKIIYFHG